MTAARQSAGAVASGSYVGRLHRGVEPVRAVWQAADARGNSTVFQSLPWTETWLDTIGPAIGAEFFVVEVLDPSGASTCLLPIVRLRRGGLRVLEVPDGGVADYVAPIMTGEQPLSIDAVGRAMKALRAALPPADIAIFRRIRPIINGSLENPLLAFPHTRLDFKSYAVQLEPNWEAFFTRTASTSRRATMRRKRRRLAELGAVSFKVVVEPAEIERALEAAVVQRRERAATVGWEGNILDFEPARAFYKAVARRQGVTHVSMLSVGTTIVATHFGAEHGRVVYWLLPTFAAGEWAQFSVGRMLLEDTLEWACGRGKSVLDLTIGDEPYKAEWNPQVSKLFEARLPLSVAGWLAVAAWKIAKKVRRSSLFAALSNRQKAGSDSRDPD